MEDELSEDEVKMKRCLMARDASRSWLVYIYLFTHSWGKKGKANILSDFWLAILLCENCYVKTYLRLAKMLYYHASNNDTDQPVELEQLGLIFGEICPASMGNDQLGVRTSYMTTNLTRACTYDSSMNVNISISLLYIISA